MIVLRIGWRPRGPRRVSSSIGAGIGGLVAALRAGRAGASTSRWSSGAAAPGGKMREVAVGGAGDRRRPDRVHHARGVRGDLRRRRATCRSRPRHAAPGRASGAPCLARRRPARPVRRRRALGRGHRRLRRRGRGAPLPRLLRRGAPRSTRRSSGPSSAPAEAQPARTDRRRRPWRARRSPGASRRSRRCGRRSGGCFPRPAPAAAVRPLRDLLRLVAVRGARHADAGRACRAGRRVAGRGRHAPSSRRPWPSSAQRSGASLPLRPAAVRSIVPSGARAAGVRLATGERIAADAVVFNADVAALGADCSAPAWPAPCAARAGPTRSLSAVTCAARRDGRLSAGPPQRVLLRTDYPAEFDAIFRERPHSATGPPSMSAPRIATMPAAPADRAPNA